MFIDISPVFFFSLKKTTKNKRSIVNERISILVIHDEETVCYQSSFYRSTSDMDVLFFVETLTVALSQRFIQWRMRFSFAFFLSLFIWLFIVDFVVSLFR